MSDTRITTLPNGLRIVTDRVTTVETVAVGVWVGIGTRNEDMAVNGVAHMVEHMLFKGTSKRNARQIAEVIEDVGGNMNAYTSRELTSYYIHLLKDDLPLALDVLADILQNSTMPEEEIERERQVILQEIGMCNDTPDDLVFDNYYEAAFPDQALGAPILGRSTIIESMQRHTLIDYTQRFYTPSRMAVCASGNIDHEKFVSMVTMLFDNLPKNRTIEMPAAYYNGGEFRAEKDLEQSHIILGFQGVKRQDEAYHASQVLATLLGGGMSSRLFQEVREKRGLVYSIFSFHSSFIDNGLFGIYAGTGPERLPELVPVVCDEIKKLSGNLTEAEVERARAQLRTSLLMGRESMISRADQNAKSLLLTDKIRPVSEIISLINAVDIPMLEGVIRRIFSSPVTLAALGPLRELEDFKNIQERLAA